MLAEKVGEPSVMGPELPYDSAALKVQLDVASPKQNIFTAVIGR